MRVSSVRRYPVKSMGGEALDAALVGARGLEWDRCYAVVDEDGRLASGKDSRRFRRRDVVLEHHARTAGGGVVVTGPAGRGWVGEPDLDAAMSRATGASVRILPEGDTPHQDAGQVSIVGTASLEWCAARWGVVPDPRRLRVNLVVATDEPFVEEGWQGHEVAVGEVALRVVDRIPRCRMVDVEQDGVTVEGRLLRHLGEERDLCLGVYADVAGTGTVRVGDPVTVR